MVEESRLPVIPGTCRVDDLALSPHNLSTVHLATLDLPATIAMTDITLREGRQVAGLATTLEEVGRYAEAAANLGLRRFEVFNRLDEISMVAQCTNADVQVLVPPGEVFGAGATYDFSAYAEAGASTLSLVSMALNPALGTLPDTIAGQPVSQDLLEDRVSLAVAAAKATGLQTNLLVLDFLRADLSVVLGLTRAALEAGADGVRLDDCCAPAPPSVYRSVVAQVRAAHPETQIAIHSHNDFGLALASQLAAVEGGADVVEGAALGMGEKAGVADLGMLAVALHLLYGYDTGVRTEQIGDFADFAAQLWNEPIPPHAPGVGRTAFGCVTDVHYLPGVLPQTFSAWPPQLIGRRTKVPTSGLMGPHALRLRLSSAGLRVPEESLTELVEAVRAEVRTLRRDLSDAELSELSAAHIR